ncbi:MAG TPA: rod shape-determining protein MreD [Microthrixaceae bacterium]|nr:rod shape-determining protein MreD [Microthrixaceae bacterium]
MLTDWGQIVRWTLVVVTTLILQVAVAAQFPVWGVVADLMVLLAVCAGIVGGPARGAIVGFWAGLLYDLARDGRLGLSALAFTLVAFAVGSLLVSVLSVRRPLAMLIVGLTSAAGELLYAVGGEIFGEHTLTHPRLWVIVGVIALVNALLSPLVLRACAWAEGPEERSSAIVGILDG